jgi:protein TonB
LQHQTQVVASLPDIRESVDQPAQTEMAVEQTSVSTEREMNHREIVEQDATVSVVQAAVAQAEPVARPLEAVTPAEPVSASAQQVVDSETVATVQQTSASVSRTAVEQVESFAEARPVEHRRLSHSKPVVQQVSVNEEAPAAIAQRVVKERTLRSFPQTQVDYGWLSDILWGRIEQLKRYPPLAKHNHWEGKVIVEAVIQDDGAIIESQIAESSGHAVLDQQALAVLKQASPLALKHPLGQRRVTILVPITYRLDG